MARRVRATLFSRSFQRTLTSLTMTALRAGKKVVKRAVQQTVKQMAKQALAQPLKGVPGPRQPATAKRRRVPEALSVGIAVCAGGVRRYRLYQPPAVKKSERLPLLVMLHGCWQDAEGLAASSRMNRIAARERFYVLYPEQDRLSNAQGCWNWYETRSGRAQGEANSIAAAIDQVCLRQAVDPQRIALAGLSAGAGMAALLASRQPQRFCAVAMHSGIAPGVAHSSATAFSAMRGRRKTNLPLASATPSLTFPIIPLATTFPALLVIHGSADPIVAPSNGAEAARWWAAQVGATAGKPRTVQRGMRYPATITDYRCRGRIVVTHCEIGGLGHAWSGGAAGRAYSDPKGPDASRMIWAFVAKQFVRGSGRARQAVGKLRA